MNTVDQTEISINGRFFKTAKPKNEPYLCLPEPADFIAKLQQTGIRADLFTFMQEIGETNPKYDYHSEPDRFAVLPISTYENWYEDKIGFRPRNKIRKAQKLGVKLRVMEFDDDCVRGIMGIYNESPLIQQKPNWHYGKDFDTMKKMLGTFEGKSEFIGAFYGDEMIGFIKLVRGKQFAGLMHIISKQAHRDKAPTNALIAKAVETCAQLKLAYLQYGVWSRRGLGDFKVSNCFECLEVPRYYVPLNTKGRLMVKMGLHRQFREHLPASWWDSAVALRDKWNIYRQRKMVSETSVK